MAEDQLGISWTLIDRIEGHEKDLEIDVQGKVEDEELEEVRSGMGETEIWVGKMT